MRMTNKIMRNNSLYNINQNKLLQDQLSNQMTNQSKIVRPSDDPVVAIRALRLRTNVTNINQYYAKNAPDADQWLSVTADALATVDDVLTDLYKQAAGASKKYLGSEDLEIILTQMKSITKEFYASGNVDYAGRYVFSGYRTDTPITFTEENITQMTKEKVKYTIEENLGFDDISTISYTDFSNLATEQDVKNTKLYRLRLSYDDLETQPAGTISLKKGNTAIAVKEYADAETAYKDIADGKLAGVAYIPNTGELVFSEKYYTGNFKEGDTYSVTYSKATWAEGDINPVHYFKCTETAADGRNITYNTTDEPQDIYYDVGYNQQIQVNSTASEVFTHAVQRDMDDFQYYLTQLKEIESQISDIETKMADFAEDSTEYKDLKKQLDAANKAYTYLRDDVQTKFENQITKYQKYMDDTNVAITNNATRGSRLELISSRLMSQKTTFKELQTNNEDIDVTEVAVELSSSELTYQAALMATSKIMQTNLMNYI